MERTTMTMTDAVIERPMTLIERLEQLEQSLTLDVMSTDSKFPYEYDAGKLNGVREAIDIVKQHTDLISLADRKPTIDGYYLVRYERPWAGNTKILKKFDVVKFENGRFQILDEYITHWMPLPQPPSEVQDD